MDKLGIRHILPLILISILAGCQKTDSPEAKTKAQAQLSVSLDIDGVEDLDRQDTKSVVSGTTLNESGRTYGLIACEHEVSPTNYITYDINNAGLYGNIQGWYGNYNSKGTAWWYSFEPTVSARFKPLYFVTEDTSRHMDIYAYAPWKAGVTIADGYPFNFTQLAESSIEDLMYASYENAEDNPSNTDITIVDGATLPLNVHFHHALSRIVFHLKLANEQNTGLDGRHAMRLWQISILKSDTSATPLYPQGNMDILSGAVTPVGASKLEQSVVYATDNNYTYLNQMHTYDIYQSDEWKNFNMLVLPTEYQQDADFSFRFMFNGNGSPQTLVQTYSIPRSDLLHPDGITYGFQPGWCYHFYFIIDNYIHLKNVVINTDWELTDETEIKV